METRCNNSAMPWNPDNSGPPQEPPPAPAAPLRPVASNSITKNTVVPISAVVAAVVLTIGAMNYLSSDRDRIIVLETQNDELQTKVAAVAKDLDGVHTKLDAQAVALAKLSAQITILNAKMDIAPRTPPKPSTNSGPSRRDTLK